MRLQNFSRRKFLTYLGARAAATLALGITFIGCSGPAKTEEKKATSDGMEGDPCSDYANVPEEDLELRRKFAYVNKSPIPDNQCDNCNLYLPPKEGSSCGACMLFKGPVDPGGYCTYWAPRVEGA